MGLPNPFGAFSNAIGKSIDFWGSTLKLPELGISEKFGYTNPSAFRAQHFGDYNGLPGAQSNQAYVANNDVVPASDQTAPTAPASTGYSTGTAGGTGYTAPAYDPTGDRAAAQAKIAALRNVYNALFGDTDAIASERKSTLDNQYNQQYGEADQGYSRGVDSLKQGYAARGLGSSSYFDNALGDATNTYQEGVNQLRTNQQNNYADIGKFQQTAKAGFQSGLDQLGQIDPSKYNTQADLQSLLNQLSGQEGQLNSTRAGFRTNSDYAKQVGGVQGGTQQVTTKLASQLSNIINSSASPLAKQQIASGLIRSISNGDKNTEDYWSNYFQSLLTQPQQQLA